MKQAARAVPTDPQDGEEHVAPRAAGRRKAATAVRGDSELQVNPLSRVIGYRLRRAQLVTFQEFIEHFGRMKLRPAEYALLTVARHQPGLSQNKAASMLGIKRANFVSLLDALERRGLAERRTVQGDRRSRAIHLTAKGLQVAEKADAIGKSYDMMLVKRLGGCEQRDIFLTMLDRLVTKD